MGYNSFIVKALSYFLFYLLLLFSLLPLWILYILSDILAFTLYYVLGYRKKVVLLNLEGSLSPDVDVHKVAKKFYRFLGDVVLETIKCLTMSKQNLLRRITCDNPEVIEKYAKEGRSVILMSGHYGNWEFLISAMNLMFSHRAVGVGKPLSNGVLNRLINDKRSRTGMKIISALNIKEEFKKDKDNLTAILFLSDQFPGRERRGYPVIFLNKSTEFMYGAEKYAREYNYPVVYADISRLKRGRYNMHLIEISTNPSATAYGDIITGYIQLMEKSIIREPQYWLWSHKRWKNLEAFYD
jgi:Kdo2-lipid IVA lauroyltransferase/acyltransferase